VFIQFQRTIALGPLWARSNPLLTRARSIAFKNSRLSFNFQRESVRFQSVPQGFATRPLKGSRALLIGFLFQLRLLRCLALLGFAEL